MKGGGGRQGNRRERGEAPRGGEAEICRGARPSRGKGEARRRVGTGPRGRGGSARGASEGGGGRAPSGSRTCGGEDAHPLLMAGDEGERCAAGSEMTSAEPNGRRGESAPLNSSCEIEISHSRASLSPSLLSGALFARPLPMALRSSLARLATSQGLSAPAGAPVFSSSLPEAKARSRKFFREVRAAIPPRSTPGAPNERTRVPFPLHPARRAPRGGSLARGSPRARRPRRDGRPRRRSRRPDPPPALPRRRHPRVPSARSPISSPSPSPLDRSPFSSSLDPERNRCAARCPGRCASTSSRR